MKSKIYIIGIFLLLFSCTEINEITQVKDDNSSSPTEEGNQLDTLTYVFNLMSFDNGENSLDNNKNIVVFSTINNAVSRHTITPIYNEIKIAYSKEEKPEKIDFSIQDNDYFSWSKTLMSSELEIPSLDVYLVKRLGNDKNANYMLNTTAEERAFWFSSLPDEWQKIFYREIIKKPFLSGIAPSDDEIKFIFLDTILNCSGENLTDDTPLKFLTNLKHLNISSNKLKILIGIMSLVNLKTLDVSNNALEFISSDLFVNNLVSIEASNNKLGQIIISNSRLEYGNFAKNSLVYCEIKKSNLTEINVKENKLLFCSISESPNLKKLSIQNNEIKKLTLNDGLLYIEAFSNNIESIEIPQTLKRGDFSNNKISEIKTNNCSLELLNLKGNISDRFYFLGEYTADTLYLESKVLKIGENEKNWWSILPGKLKTYFSSILGANETYKYISSDEYKKLAENVTKISLSDCTIENKIFYNRLADFKNLTSIKLENCKIATSFDNKFYKDTLERVEIVDCNFSFPIVFDAIEQLSISNSSFNSITMANSKNVTIKGSTIGETKINKTNSFIVENTSFLGNVTSYSIFSSKISGGTILGNLSLSGTHSVVVDNLPSNTTIIGATIDSVILKGSSSVSFDNNVIIEKVFDVSGLNNLNINSSAFINTDINLINVESNNISFEDFILGSNILPNISYFRLKSNKSFKSFDLRGMTHVATLNIETSAIESFKAPTRPNNITYQKSFAPIYNLCFISDSIYWTPWHFNSDAERYNDWYYTRGECVNFRSITIKNVKKVDLTFGTGNFGIWKHSVGSLPEVHIANAEEVVCPQTEISPSDTISPWLTSFAQRFSLYIDNCKKVSLDKNLFLLTTITNTDEIMIGNENLSYKDYSDKRYFTNLTISNAKRVDFVNSFLPDGYNNIGSSEIHFLNSFLSNSSIQTSYINLFNAKFYGNYLNCDSANINNSKGDFYFANKPPIVAYFRDCEITEYNFFNDYSYVPYSLNFESCFFNDHGVKTLRFVTCGNGYTDPKVSFRKCNFNSSIPIKIDNGGYYSKSSYAFDGCIFNAAGSGLDKKNIFDIYNTSYYQLALANCLFIEAGNVTKDGYTVSNHSRFSNSLSISTQIASLCNFHLGGVSSPPYYRVSAENNFYITPAGNGSTLNTLFGKEDLNIPK